MQVYIYIPLALKILALFKLINSFNVISQGTTFAPKEEEQRDTGAKLILDLVVVLALVVVAGLMSGLTLGMLSLDTVNLEIIINAGSKRDAANAKKYVLSHNHYNYH